MSEVESINPNTPVTSNLTKEGTIEADATGGPISFDELEQITKEAKTKKSEKKKSSLSPKTLRLILTKVKSLNQSLVNPKNPTIRKKSQRKMLNLRKKSNFAR